MDPMAGLGGGNQGPSDATSGEGREIFNSQVAQKNGMALSDARTFMSIVSGVFSGIMGATGLYGAGIFLSLHLLTGLALLIIVLGEGWSETTACCLSETFSPLLRSSHIPPSYITNNLASRF